MPFTIYTRESLYEYDSACTYCKLRKETNVLGINGGFIICDRGTTYYVFQMLGESMQIMSFGDYPGYALCGNNVITTVCPISDNEKNRYLTEINELANNFSAEKATDLINRLHDRLSRIIDLIREVGINTEPISNVKRSSTC